MSTKKEADDAIKQLTFIKNHFEERQRKGATIYNNYTTGGYLSSKQLEEEIQKNEAMQPIPPGLEPATKIEQKAAVISSIGYLILSGVSVYGGLNVDKTWKQVLLFILAFIWALGALFTYTTRKIKRKMNTGK